MLSGGVPVVEFQVQVECNRHFCLSPKPSGAHLAIINSLESTASQSYESKAVSSPDPAGS